MVVWRASLLSGRSRTSVGAHALASAWQAFWVSRVLVLAAAVAGLIGFGTSAYRANTPGASDPTDSVNGVLLSPGQERSGEGDGRHSGLL
jgi:hypothetical protein